MDTLDQPLNTETIITPQAASNLSRTWPWMTLVGIFFIIAAIMMLITGLGVFTGSDQAKSQGLGNAFMLMGVFFIIGSALFGYAGFLAIQTGTKISSFLKFNNASTLEQVTAHQQRFWLLMGVYGILLIVFMIGFSILARKAMALAI
jgi:hypothetical protein